VSSIRATVTASDAETRILIRTSIGDVLIARLGPLENAQRYALRSLLEAIALWEQQRVDVVLFADDRSDWQRTGLLDALDVARELALLRVQLVPAELRHRRAAKRLTGLGSFVQERDRLRQVANDR